MSTNRIVVVGASLAGGRAAETLRRQGWEGEIVLVGEEPHRPYDRPPLSKKFLRGQVAEEKLALRPLAHYERLKIELELGARATSLDPSARTITLESGRRIGWDQLIIATGGHVRRLTCPGATLEGVHYVRTIEDARTLREELRAGRRAVVIGAGVIGCEVAASCREEGVAVTMIEAAPLPLLRAFGPEVGRIYADVHRGHGVDLRCGTGVERLVGERRVEAVITSAGERVECDFVVVGIGITPAVQWLEGAGIALDGHVVVDEHMQTSIAGVYAVGDVARAWDRRLGRRVCVESIDNAQTQAVVAATRAVGKDAAHATVPFFWSDQYDLKLQSVGHVGDFDRVVVRGSIEERAFVAFHLEQGVLRFAIGVNRLQELGATKKLIAAGASVPDAVLADADASLAEWVPKAT
ncbi:NAD(P)/FAD-dependent oxidoreductase [Sandaracinus amylolyticus]|uniref:Ferredoxin reductase n=1 Tax=Sandaracinus amylolyticus TaxID=927083 RepID=A0A0F6YFQ4_9BACT|nr:FAD-dependent oxidoreductase [Sandaracinus amylolyticus]AKF02951.1 Ferredoxin reductase [Sandaracinus amylolyticus]